MKSKLRDLIGYVPDEAGFKKRMRVHQGWWRTCVLAEYEGKHPVHKDRNVCNTIYNGEVTGKNFLTENILQVVNQTLLKRSNNSKGLIQEDRLFNNLLSSQPLCFNFFGELCGDKDLALGILRQFFPQLTEVREIYFEFAPSQNVTDSHHGGPGVSADG